MNKPIALLLRGPDRLEASEPVLACASGACAETCDVYDDCQMFGNPGDLIEAPPSEEEYERRETAREAVCAKS